jgi:hypothetical protein
MYSIADEEMKKNMTRGICNRLTKNYKPDATGISLVVLKEFIKSEIENIWYVIINGYNNALNDGSITQTTDKYIDIIIDSIITLLKQIVKKIKNMNIITLEQMKSIYDELDKNEIIIENKIENSAKNFSFLIYLCNSCSKYVIRV